MSRTPAFRKLAAGSAALALAAAGSAALASPAVAATSQTLNYTCVSPSLGEFPVTAVHEFGETAVYGGELPVTTTLTLSAQTVGGLNFFGIKAIDGTAVGTAAMDGATITADETIPKTAVPASGTMDLVAEGVANTGAAGGTATAGETVPLALVDTANAEIVAQLYTWDAEDQRSPAATQASCELADGQDLTIGMVSVTQAASATVAKLAYKAKTGKVVSTAVVDSPDSEAAPVGDVKLVLKRNGTKVDSATVALKDGMAKMATEAKKSGNYKLVAKYLGNTNFAASEDELTKSFS